MVKLRSVHNQFMFLCVSWTHGLEVTITSETAKLMVSNLKIIVSKKFWLIVCLLMICRPNCNIVDCFFSCCAQITL